MRILFFIESLRCGGKERRLLELIRYLVEHTDNEILLVLTEDQVHYKYVYDIDVEIRVIRRKFIKKNPWLFFSFFIICRRFKPDIIHTWGSMLSFYALPVIILKKIPHVNGHISDAPDQIEKRGFSNVVRRLGFRFSDIILSNSRAGLESYGLSGHKCHVIHNGVWLDRFRNLPDKEIVKAHFNIRTVYVVIMVASFTKNKNYGQFLDIAEYLLQQRKDISFVGVGGPLGNTSEYEKIKRRSESLENVILCGRVDNIESLINACDIGVLFSNSEGLSNSIIEYMACGKPAIVNDVGGNRELITNNITGYLLEQETTEEISSLIIDLLEDENKREELGRRAKLHIEKHFSIDHMGREFEHLYEGLLEMKKADIVNKGD